MSTALIGWAIAATYFAVGAACGAQVGAWQWARERERWVYTPSRESVYFAVALGIFTWPVVWPIWKITSVIIATDPVTEDDRVPA